MVRANNQSITVQTPAHQQTKFDVTGMILGNTYQTNIDPGCHIQLRILAGSVRTIEVHTPPDDVPMYRKLITCVVR